MFTISKLNSKQLGDFKNLIQLFEKVFEMPKFVQPNDTYLYELLEGPEFMVFVAYNNEKRIVGGLTAYILKQYYSTRPLVYVFDLAVKKDYQRMGVGSSLIQHIRQYCADQNMEEVFVQADKVDQYAIEFYRSTHTTEEEDVSHFYYKL